MNIGFDAKRYFHNPTGLGNYSRTLVNGLGALYPQHQYLLFNPRPSRQFAIPPALPITEVLPAGWINTRLSALWRSSRVTEDLRKLKVDLYHGLSHEIPAGIDKTGVRSVVTIHDLIFERYPRQYSAFDVRMHRRKIRYACAHADRVIAISKQTATDLVEWYGVAPQKIDVCYQSCDPIFAQVQEDKWKEEIRKAYDLPPQFLFYVGSIIERKNLLGICKALTKAGDALQLPLVVVGAGKEYKQQVLQYVQAHNLERRVIFLSDREPVKQEYSIRAVSNLAALYQMASALIYPSFYEGFGIPVLEALWSRVPVITSNLSCMPETGGEGVYYVDPASVDEMAQAMIRIQDDPELCTQLIAKGWEQAQTFTLEKCVGSVMSVYQKVMNDDRF